jgi:hypothetical protein
MNRLWTLLHGPCVTVRRGMALPGCRWGFRSSASGEDARTLAVAKWVEGRFEDRIHSVGVLPPAARRDGRSGHGAIDSEELITVKLRAGGLEGHGYAYTIRRGGRAVHA